MREDHGNYIVGNAQYLMSSVRQVSTINSEVFALTNSGVLYEQTERIGAGLRSNGWYQIGTNVNMIATGRNYYGRTVCRPVR